MQIEIKKGDNRMGCNYVNIMNMFTLSSVHCLSLPQFHVSEPVACSGVHPVTYNTCHYVEMILQVGSNTSYMNV